MIRRITVLTIVMLSAVPALGQNTAADDSCRVSEFVQENNLSSIYVEENARVTLNAQLGSMSSCTATLKLKPCFYATVNRAESYVAIYNRGQTVLNEMQMLLGVMESTSWHYKVESSLLSTSFSDVQFGDFVSNDITARSQSMVGGGIINFEKLQELIRDEKYWNAVCSLGTISEDQFKAAWDKNVAKREARDAAEAASNQENVVPLPPQSIEQFVGRIRSCWVIPPGARESNVVVKVRIDLKQDGSLASPPSVLSERDDKLFNDTAQSVVKAITKCQKYPFFPADQYHAWQTLVLNFDPNMFPSTD